MSTPDAVADNCQLLSTPSENWVTAALGRAAEWAEESCELGMTQQSAGNTASLDSRESSSASGLPHERSRSAVAQTWWQETEVQPAEDSGSNSALDWKLLGLGATL